jgi:hypothetical protein
MNPLLLCPGGDAAHKTGLASAIRKMEDMEIVKHIF